MSERIAITDVDATEVLGPRCPDCGWRRGQHRPAILGQPACPRHEAEPTT